MTTVMRDKNRALFKIWIRILSWTRLPLMLAFTCRSTWMKKAGHKEVSKRRTRGESEQFLAYRWGNMQVRDPPWLWNPVHEFNGKFLPPIPNILSPPANVVCEGYVFTSVCPQEGGWVGGSKVSIYRKVIPFDNFDPLTLFVIHYRRQLCPKANSCATRTNYHSSISGFDSHHYSKKYVGKSNGCHDRHQEAGVVLRGELDTQIRKLRFHPGLKPRADITGCPNRSISESRRNVLNFWIKKIHSQIGNETAFEEPGFRAQFQNSRFISTITLPLS